MAMSQYVKAAKEWMEDRGESPQRAVGMHRCLCVMMLCSSFLVDTYAGN